MIAFVTSNDAQDEVGTPSVRILVVDDFHPYRTFTASTLSKQPGFEIVGEAADGLEAVQKAEELRPDLVILDIAIPKLNGIEVAKKIRAVSPDSKILFLTGNDYPQIAREAMDAGQGGYVVKLDAADELLAAVEAVLLGKQYVSKRLAGPGFLDEA